MYYKQKLGKKGEKIAEEYLKIKGYKIIEKNFSCRQGEVDIIALDKNEIVFIEVKTRTNTHYGEAREAVNETKQKHIKKVARYYLYKKHLEEEYVRIDVIEVYCNNERQVNKLNHIKQIL